MQVFLIYPSLMPDSHCYLTNPAWQECLVSGVSLYLMSFSWNLTNLLYYCWIACRPYHRNLPPLTLTTNSKSIPRSGQSRLFWSSLLSAHKCSLSFISQITFSWVVWHGHSTVPVLLLLTTPSIPLLSTYTLESFQDPLNFPSSLKAFQGSPVPFFLPRTPGWIVDALYVVVNQACLVIELLLNSCRSLCFWKGFNHLVNPILFIL